MGYRLLYLATMSIWSKLCTFMKMRDELYNLIYTRL